MKRDQDTAGSPPNVATARTGRKQAAAAAPPTTSDGNKCRICAKVFTYGNDLRKHLRIHTDERPFPCAQCDQRFRQAGCLKNHVASQHGGAESFSCHYCAKAFPIKERLRLHMRIHSGEKPYKCAKCQRSFSRGGQLKQHMITHRDCRSSFLGLNAAGSAPGNHLNCAFCGQSFKRKLLLKKHARDCDKRLTSVAPAAAAKSTARQRDKNGTNISSPFECDVCDSTFAQHSQLRVHKRMHSGERPYKCQVCWHSFAHSSVLKLHIRKHTGEKPFKCAVCADTAFSQLPHLKTHMRTIHGMDKTYQCICCRSFYKTKNEHQLHTASCAPAAAAATSASSDHRSLSEAADVATKAQTEKLSQMRLCAAVLLKRITTGERLKQLGFEKVLIDNVIMAALRKADQPFECDTTKSDLERFCVNVRYFLEWTIPKNILEKFEHKETNVKELLVKLTQNQ